MQYCDMVCYKLNKSKAFQSSTISIIWEKASILLRLEGTTIFLSHSGAQKDFVERLWVELKAQQRDAFLDIKSLPNAQSIPDFIFNTISHSKLLVLVLSKEFFSRSKWPMLELQVYVQTKKSKKNPQLELLPLFFMVSTEDVKNPRNKEEWEEKWNYWAESDIRIDLNQWREALEVLKNTEGLIFQQGMREVEYISMIVETICKIVPPYMTAPLTSVQGAERICQEMINKINQLPCKETRLASETRILAVYGSTGMGKTTLCTKMCNYFRRNFRVCHIEIGDGNLDRLALQKRVLKQLTGAPYNLLEDIHNSDEGQYLLNQRINKQPVFLAIDIVSTTESSITIARMFLRLRLTKESLVLLTACTYKNLLDVIGNDISGNCFHLPNLTEEEAICILLERATPNCSFDSLPDLQQKIAKYYTSLSKITCNIHSNSSTYEGQMEMSHYHPPSLIEKGAHLGGNPNNWAHKLLFSCHFSKQNEKFESLSDYYKFKKGLRCVLEHPEPSNSSSYIKRDSLQQFVVWRNMANFR